MSDIDKKLADASKASNDFVQAKGAKAAPVMPYVVAGIGVVVVLAFISYLIG